MDNLRFEVLKEAFRKRPVELKMPKERPSELFGKNVFNREKMFKYLPIDVYNKMVTLWIMANVLTVLLLIVLLME